MLSESNDSLMKSDDSYESDRCFVDEIDGNREGTEIFPCCSREIVNPEHNSKQPMNVETTKKYKLARALAWITLEGYDKIFWISLGDAFHEYVDDVFSFGDEVFEVMARFVWNLYDQEDFESIAYTDDIFDECERIQKLVGKGNIELDSSLLDVSEYEKVREQDVCNIFKWCDENNSPDNNGLEEFSKFKWEILRDPESHPLFEPYIDNFIDLALKAMLWPDNLDPKGMVKHQLRMELNDRKCFCIVDALYMQSWQHINFQKLEALLPGQRALKDILRHIHFVFEEFVETRIQRLHNCQKLVTYPLSCNKFGSWDNEAVELVKQADLKRQSEGRRFIGTDHLIFCLHQTLVSESSKVLMPTDIDDKHKDTIYHLYRRAYKIATELGHKMIGLEHIYVAITSAGDDKRYWKDSVEGVRIAKAKRKDENEDEGHEMIGLEQLLVAITSDESESSLKNSVERVRMAIAKVKAEYEEMDKPYPYLWSRFFVEGKRRSVIELAKEIQDASTTPLQESIYDRLFRVYEPPQQMSEGAMIKSLKNNIEISSKPPKPFAAHLAFVMFLAVGTCRFMQHIGSMYQT